MPSQPSTRISQGGSNHAAEKAVSWLRSLPSFQRNIIFLIGAVLVLVPVANVVVNHIIRNAHPDTLGIIIAEGSISGASVIFGLSMMIPPLGIWILSRVFRIKYLNSGSK